MVYIAAALLSWPTRAPAWCVPLAAAATFQKDSTESPKISPVENYYLFSKLRALIGLCVRFQLGTDWARMSVALIQIFCWPSVHTTSTSSLSQVADICVASLPVMMKARVSAPACSHLVLVQLQLSLSARGADLPKKPSGEMIPQTYANTNSQLLRVIRAKLLITCMNCKAMEMNLYTCALWFLSHA